MNNQNIILLFELGLFLVSTLLVGLYIRYATLRGIIDIPNARSAHKGLVPRGAGIVFMCLWLLSGIFGYQTQVISGKTFLLFLPTPFLFGLIGFWDDYKSLSAKSRLVMQLSLSTLFMFLLMSLHDLSVFNQFFTVSGFIFGVIPILVGLLVITWSVNLYNFMDGIDGLAAIEALFVLGGGAFLCYQHGAFELSLLALTMLVAVSGFLVWNWPKASVFMGDAGSYCLGCLMSLLAIGGYWIYQIPITLWLILYGLFWFDATLTLLRRFFFNKNIASPHRDHAYQRLHHAGFSQHQLLFGVIGLNMILLLLASYADYKPEYLGICFVFCLVLLTLVTLWIEKRKPLLRDS